MVALVGNDLGDWCPVPGLAVFVDDDRGSTGGDQVLLGCSEAVFKRAGVMLVALEDFGCEDHTGLHVDDVLGLEVDPVW